MCNTANESQLIPQKAPTSSPTAKTSKTALPNRDQTTVSAPPVVNETKLEITDGTQPSTKQLEAENPVIPMEKTRMMNQLVTKNLRLKQVHPKLRKRTLTKLDKTK